MAEKLNKNIWSLFNKSKQKMNNENPVKDQVETPETEAHEGVEEQAVDQPNAEESKAEITDDTEEKVIEVKSKKKKRSGRGGSGAKKMKQLENDVEALEKEVVAIENERNEVKDKYLRLFAEFDNYKKRTARERLDILKTASADIIRELLPVLDDFDRAKSISEEGLPEGIQLIYDKLLSNLSRKGVKPVESNGQPFDAELHEAITQIPAPTEEMKGKVIDTVERGYTLNDKIIRYAKVVVGK